MGSGAVGIARIIKDYGKEWKFQSGGIGLLALGFPRGSEGVWCSWLALIRTMLDFLSSGRTTHVQNVPEAESLAVGTSSSGPPQLTVIDGLMCQAYTKYHLNDLHRSRKQYSKVDRTVIFTPQMRKWRLRESPQVPHSHRT